MWVSPKSCSESNMYIYIYKYFEYTVYTIMTVFFFFICCTFRHGGIQASPWPCLGAAIGSCLFGQHGTLQGLAWSGRVGPEAVESSVCRGMLRQGILGHFHFVFSTSGGRQTGQNRGGTCPFVQAQKETGWMPTAVPLLVEALKNWMGGLLSCCFWLPEPGDF